MQSTQSPKPDRSRDELVARVLSGVVLLAVVLLSIWWQGLLLMLLITLAAGLAWHELYGIAWARGYRLWYPVGLVLALLLALWPYLVGGNLLSGEVYHGPATDLELTAIALLLMLALVRLGMAWFRPTTYGSSLAQTPSEFRRLHPEGTKPLHPGWTNIPLTFAGALFTGGLLGYGPQLLGVQETATRAGGIPWTLVPLLGTVACDTGAWLFGKYFAKRIDSNDNQGSRVPKYPMSPHISPKKSWEGFVGGLLATIVTAVAFAGLLKISLAQAVPLGGLICISVTSGDLVESLMKRTARLKDSGSSIPGHGGLLDRIDSHLFTLAAVYWFVQVLVPI